MRVLRKVFKRGRPFRSSFAERLRTSLGLPEASDLKRNAGTWHIGLVGTPSPAIRYLDSGDSVLLGAGGVVCSG